MADEVLGNIVAELRRRGNFGGFREERVQSLLEEMWNEVEYALKGLRKSAGQLEDCSDSKGMQSVLNGSTLNIFWGRQVSYASSVLQNLLTTFV